MERTATRQGSSVG